MVAFKMSPRFAAPSQNFEKNMSGDAMRNCLSSEQENVGSNMSRPQQPKQVALPMFGGSGQQFAQPFAQPEYPKPGSEATCDSCGTVVTRFFHCQDCQEDVGGLFDLCPGCCAACYLQGGMKPDHPTHDYEAHRMTKVAPPGQQ